MGRADIEQTMAAFFDADGDAGVPEEIADSSELSDPRRETGEYFLGVDQVPTNM